MALLVYFGELLLFLFSLALSLALFLLFFSGKRRKIHLL